MCESVTITLPWPPKELHAHAKGHWRGKAAATKKARRTAEIHALAICIFGKPKVGLCHWPRASVLYRLFMPDSRNRDTANMVQACKPYLDGIVDAGVIQDDNWKCLSVSGVEVDIDRDNPRVELVIERKA